MKQIITKLIKSLNNSNATPELEQIRLGRTLTSTIFEGIGLAETLIMCIALGWLAAKGDGTHTLELALTGLFTTVATASLLVMAYQPTKSVNLPFRVKTLRQVQLMALLERIQALFVPPLGTTIALMLCGMTDDAPVNAVAITMVTVTLVMCIVIWIKR